MNKSDKVFVVIVAILALAIYLFSDTLFSLITSDDLQVVVYLNDDEYGRYPMNQNQTVNVPGKLGDVVIEIETDRVRIATENSPLHICSLQGWVNRAYVPLICQPNFVVVQIENSNNVMDEPDIDTTTQ